MADALQEMIVDFQQVNEKSEILNSAFSNYITAGKKLFRGQLNQSFVHQICYVFLSQTL